jgi:hypothetical protein
VAENSQSVVEQEFSEDDELGQIEASDVPAYDMPPDPYVPDPGYDVANDSVDPEGQGEGPQVGASGSPVESEGGVS